MVFIRLLAAAICLVCANFAAAADGVVWRTGRDLQQTLEKNVGPAGLIWSGQGIRDAVKNLSRSNGIRVAMLVDRRIDPDAKVDLSVGDVPLSEAISKLAGSVKAGEGSVEVGQIGAVAYMGPAATARRVRTLVELRKEEIQKLPAAEAKRFQQAKPLRWDDLAEPRELLKGIASGAGVKLVNPEVVPHDLWGAADLPAMSLAERLTLVAAAYDLTFAIESSGGGATAIRLAPMPDRVAIVKTYPAGSNAKDTAAKLAAALPGAKIAARGNRVEVDGRAEEQAQAAEILSGKPIRKPATPGAVALERLRIESFAAENQPLGPLIKQIAKKLQLEAEFDTAGIATAKIDMNQLVSLQIKSGTAIDLLKKITQPYGLEYELKGKKLVVQPAEKAGGSKARP